MAMQFLRGNPQAPRGHAIFVARSSGSQSTVFCTYCIVPPIPMSLAKYLPPMFAAQIPADELGDAASVAGMPIPPMLEEGFSLPQLEQLAEHRGDDLCDLGTISARDEVSRMQLATMSSQEYAQLYTSYIASVSNNPSTADLQPSTPLDDLDTDELLFQTMPDSQKLAELSKLIGTARYAVEGHDNALVEDTRKKMQRISRLLADKYRGTELIAAATSPNQRGARLAELYLSRAYKLQAEEYAEIPAIERSIRELQDE